MMETKEQMLYRINRINRNNLMNDLNMKRKKLIVKYNPKEINKDELPISQREFINYKKKFNKQLLKNKQLINPEFINISSFKPEERKLIIGDKDEELVGSLLISDEVKQENYNKIDELFKKNLIDKLMDFQTYTYVNQQIGDDYIYKNMINNNIVGIEKKIRDKYKSLTANQFIFEIKKYFEEPQPIQSSIITQSKYTPLINYTPSQKEYYEKIKNNINKLKTFKNVLSKKYFSIQSDINNKEIQDLITEYNDIIKKNEDLLNNVDDALNKYNDELKEIPNYKDDEISKLMSDLDSLMKNIEDNYNLNIELLTDIDNKINKKSIKIKNIEGFMKKKEKNKYNIVINKLKEIRDNQDMSEAIINMFDDSISYLNKTIENKNLSDENKEDIFNDEIKEVNDVLINNNIEPIELTEEQKEKKEKINKLIGSIEKVKKNKLLSIFLKKLDEFMIKNKIMMNEIIKEIVEEAIKKVNEIENNKDLSMEEKKDNVDIVLNETKKKMTNLESKLKNNLDYINKLLDYTIEKKPENEELKKIKEVLNKSTDYKDLLKKIEDLYYTYFPNGTSTKYDIRLKNILMKFDFSEEELKDIEKDTTQNEEILKNTLIKVDKYSELIKDFIKKNAKNESIKEQINLLEKVDNIIIERTLMDTKEGIEKYRKKIVDFYNDLKQKKINKNYVDENNNILYGLENTDIPDLKQNNIMKMISKIYDVYLGNITEVINKSKETKNIKATKENIEKLFGEKKKYLDDQSTEATITEEKIPEIKEKKKKK